MPVGVILLGSSGKIIFSNPASYRILGIESADFEGQKLGAFALHDKRNLDFVQIIIDAVYNKQALNEALVNYYCNDVCTTIKVNTRFLEEEDANMGVLIMLS